MVKNENVPADVQQSYLKLGYCRECYDEGSVYFDGTNSGFVLAEMMRKTIHKNRHPEMVADESM